MFEDKTIKELLNEIIAKEGPYSQNQLQHAENVINSASQKALEIRTRLEKLFARALEA